jgi:hypothetical protein
MYGLLIYVLSKGGSTKAALTGTAENPPSLTQFAGIVQQKSNNALKCFL